LQRINNGIERNYIRENIKENQERWETGADTLIVLSSSLVFQTKTESIAELRAMGDEEHVS
jgi:hypothetical protein